jgi:hypothetical protein
MKRLLLLIPLCYSIVAYSQASWTYHIGFALNDKEGRPLYRQDFTAGKYQLFSSKNAGRSSGHAGKFDYVESLGLYCFSGGTINVGIHLGLTNGQDSIVVVFPLGKERIILTNWPTKPGLYILDTRQHPQAIQYYPTQLCQENQSLFSFAVLDWDKFRSNQPNGGRMQDYFQKQEQVSF